MLIYEILWCLYFQGGGAEGIKDLKTGPKPIQLRVNSHLNSTWTAAIQRLNGPYTASRGGKPLIYLLFTPCFTGTCPSPDPALTTRRPLLFN